MSLLLPKIVEVARRYLGVRETAPNSDGGGPIDRWLAGVRQLPGASWCVAFAHGVVGESCAELGLITPMPPVASGLRLWELLAHLRRPNPAPGFLYVLDHGKGQSHVGIVCELDPLAGVGAEVSGNTFAERGGREGNQVAEHFGQPEVTHGGELLGYIDLSETSNQGV